MVALILAGLCLSATVSAQQAERGTLLIVPTQTNSSVEIYQVSGTQLTLLKTLPIGKSAREVCVSPNGKRAYISNFDGNSVTVVDLESLRVVATITNPGMVRPDGGAVSPDSKRLYLTALGKDSVFVISTETNKVIQEIPLKLHRLRRVTFSPDGSKIYVTCNDTPEIAVIDARTNQVLNTIKVGTENRGGLAFTPDGKTFVAGSVEDDTLYYVDVPTEKVERIIGIPGSPQRIEISPEGKVFVLCRLGLRLVNENQSGPVLFGIYSEKHDQSKAVVLGKAPWGLAMSRDGKLLYVSNTGSNNIMVIDATTLQLLNTVETPGAPESIALRQ